ncbi:MAG: BA14K family protein [Bradyrhizobium sp.]
MNLSSKAIALALMVAASPWPVAPAGALPVSSTAVLRHAAAAPVETVQYRRGWHGGGRGVGVGAGFVAGAIIGGAIAGSGPYGYGPGPYGYSGYAAPGYVQPGYVDQGYVDQGDLDDGYAAVVPGGGGGAAYCAQRYRSYDPASGSFLGFDGLRHPCP